MSMLVIDNRQHVTGIQKQFSNEFPFLKIEFFKEPATDKKGIAKNRMYLSTEEPSTLKKINAPVNIQLSKNMTVVELEKLFETEAGLFVQVFRKSGNVWLETTATDDWTLNEQNEQGKNLQEYLKIEKENFNDHDIY